MDRAFDGNYSRRIAAARIGANGINGEKVSTSLGYRFISHNTALQPNGARRCFQRTRVAQCGVAEQHLLLARVAYPTDSTEPRNDFKNDLTGGYLGGRFVNSMLLASDRMEWYVSPFVKKIQWGRIESVRNGKRVAIADPLIDAPAPAIDKGVRLPGFNDDFTGAVPDIGAIETGLPPLRFGREAAPGFTRAPWERY